MLTLSPVIVKGKVDPGGGSGKAPDYAWVSEGEIYSGKYGFSFLADDIDFFLSHFNAFPSFERSSMAKSCNLVPSNCMLFSGEEYLPTGTTTEVPVYILVDRGSPSKGIVYHQEGLDAIINEISIDNSSIITPSPTKKIITKGALWVALYPSGDWVNDPDKYITKEELKLVYNNDGNLVTVEFSKKGDHRGFKEKTSDGGYLFNPFTIAYANNGEGLPEGKYQFEYKKRYNSTCEGSTEGKILEEAVEGTVCDVVFKGIVNFDLKYHESGIGIVTLTGNGEELEQSFKNGLRSDSSSSYTTSITGSNPIRMEVKEIVDSPFARAMQKSMETIAGFIESATELAIEGVNQHILESTDFDRDSVKNIASAIRNTALGLLTLGLLIIAFANILNINLEQYGVTKLIPKFVLGIVLAYFSYLICIVILELMNGLQLLLVNSTWQAAFPGKSVPDPSTQMISATNFGTFISNYYDNLGQVLLMILIAIALLLAYVWIWIIMVVRKAVIMFLIAISPLAFIFSIMPFSEKYYKQWWGQFWKWAFMGPAVVLFFYIAMIFMGAYTESKSSLADFSGLSDSSDWIMLVTVLVLIIIAGVIPLKMGSEVYGVVTKMGKKVGSWAGKETGISAALDERKKWKEMRQRSRGMAMRNWLAKRGPVGEWAAGTRGVITGKDEKALRALREGRIKELSDLHNIENLSFEDVAKLAKESKDDELKLAAYRHLADKGKLSKQIEKGNVDAYDVQRLAREDSGLANSIFKDDKAAWASIDLAGAQFDTDPQDQVEHKTAIAAAQSTNLSELTSSQYKVLMKTNKGRSIINSKLTNSEAVKKLLEGENEESIAAAGHYLYLNPHIAKEMEKRGIEKENISKIMSTAQEFHKREGRRPLDPQDFEQTGKNQP